MNKKTIICSHIAKQFGQGNESTSPLQDITFEAEESELIMLMGPSGSGKTTLISIIAGIMKQDSGNCLVLENDINNLDEEQRTAFRGKNIGFIFQNFNLVPTLTAVENTAIPLLLNGHTRTDAFTKAARLLKTLGLEKQLARLPQDLSGGEQQRIAIARACIHDPKIILCDEPTSYLDSERGKQVMELLVRIKNERRCTLIVVTHDPRILHYAQTILTIDNGKLSITKNSSS